MMGASSLEVTRSRADSQGGYIWRATFLGVSMTQARSVSIELGQNNLTDAEGATVTTYVESPREGHVDYDDALITWSEVQAVTISSTSANDDVMGTFRLTLDLSSHGFQSATTSPIHHDAVASREDEIEPFQHDDPVHNGVSESVRNVPSALSHTLENHSSRLEY